MLLGASGSRPSPAKMAGSEISRIDALRVAARMPTVVTPRATRRSCTAAAFIPLASIDRVLSSPSHGSRFLLGRLTICGRDGEANVAGIMALGQLPRDGLL